MDRKIISTIKKYKPTGKITALTIPILLIMGSILGIFSSWLVSFFMSLLNSKYLLVVYPAFIGFFCGIGIRLGIKFGKCRNSIISTISVFFVGIISYIAFLMFQSLKSGTGFELLQYIMFISNKGYIFKYFRIVEIGVWFLWSFELIVVFFMAYFISKNRVKKPFCESCKKWCNEKQMFIAKSNELENVLNAIKNENYEALKTLLNKGMSKVKSLNDNVIVEMLYCKNCNCSGFLTVSNVTTVGKKIKDELIKTYLLYATINDKKAIEDLLNL